MQHQQTRPSASATLLSRSVISCVTCACMQLQHVMFTCVYMWKPQASQQLLLALVSYFHIISPFLSYPLFVLRCAVIYLQLHTYIHTIPIPQLASAAPTKRQLNSVPGFVALKLCSFFVLSLFQSVIFWSQYIYITGLCNFFLLQGLIDRISSYFQRIAFQWNLLLIGFQQLCLTSFF